MSANANGRGRANGEGSFYPHRNGWAAYVWVTTPTGQKDRKYIYGQDRQKLYDEWVQLKAKAAKVPIPTSTPIIAEYLAYWLEEVIKPNREDAPTRPTKWHRDCTSFRVSARSELTNLPCGSPRRGSTSSPATVSAAHRGRTQAGRNHAAARSARAAGITLDAASLRPRGTRCAPRSTTRCARN